MLVGVLQGSRWGTADVWFHSSRDIQIGFQMEGMELDGRNTYLTLEMFRLRGRQKVVLMTIQIICKTVCMRVVLDFPWSAVQYTAR